MARPKKKPRLRQRGDVLYIIHGEARISTGTQDREAAERALAQYVAGLACPAPPEGAVLGDLLEAYRRAQVERRRDKVAKKARQVAKVRDLTPEGVEEFVALEVAKVGDKSSVEFEVKALLRHLRRLDPQNVNNATARFYRDQRREDRNRITGEPIQDATILKDLGILNAAIRWAWKEDRGAWFPTSERPEFAMPVTAGEPRKKYLTHAEAARLLTACHLPHVKLFIRIALQTGARKGAIEELAWHNVDFERQTIDFGSVDHRKRRPVVKMPPDLLEAMRAAHAVRCSDYVVEYDGRRAGNVKKSIKAVAKKAGLPWVTSHVFKHTHISWLVREGLPYDDIADLVDTTTAVIRQHYAHLHPDNLEVAAEAVRIA